MRLDLHTARPSAPSRLLHRGSWPAGKPTPARRNSMEAAPPAPAAGSHRNRGEQASPGQRAGTPHRWRPVKAGEHEPDGQNDASDTRFVACPGKAEGRKEAERPPALQAPPGRANGGHSAPPPPQAAPRDTNATNPPRGTQPPQGVQAKGTE